MLGRVLGRFRIVGHLGDGGMASVWRAEDPLGGEVAVKTLAPGLFLEPLARRRFGHEARIAARLDHPGIVPVLDSGEEADVAWMAMGLVRGRTIAQRVLASLPGADETVRLMAEAADALAYAHARGVFHRDLTSHNLMVTDDGRCVVLDFGLALADGVSRLTELHTVVGNLATLPPEVLRGAAADARGDVYSLGLVVFEMLTGALPFAELAGDARTAARLAHDPDPPSRLRPGLPAALDALVLHMLARDPDARTGSMAEVAARLRSSLEPHAEPGVRPVTSPAPASVSAHPAPRYLVIAPVTHDAEPDAAGLELARGLERTLIASLAGAPDLRVVTPSAGPPEGADRESVRRWAQREGATHLLAIEARRRDESVRLAWTLRDVMRAIVDAGGTVDGDLRGGFELEDRLIADLRSAFSLGEGPKARAGRPETDPADELRLRQVHAALRRNDIEIAVDGAIQWLERMQRGMAGDPRVEALLARACLLKAAFNPQRQWETRATRHAEAAERLAPDLPEVRVALGDVMARGHRHDEAIAHYEAVLRSAPDDVDAGLGLGVVVRRLSRHDDVDRICERLLRGHPDDWRVHGFAGMCCFTRGEYPAAIEHWQRGLRCTPDNPRLMQNMAAALFHLDRFEEAARWTERGLELQPHATGFGNLGAIQFMLGRFPEAEQAFRDALRLAPERPQWAGYLGVTLRRMPGRHSEANEVIDGAITRMRERLEREPNDADDWAQLATWLMDRQRPDEADAAMARANELAPDHPHVVVAAAAVHCLAGRIDDALAAVRRAIELGYGPEQLRMNPDLAALHDHSEFRKFVDRSVD